MTRIIISTKRLELKPLGIKYLQTVNEYAAYYENTKYMCYLPNDNIDETASFLSKVDLEWKKEKPDYYEFAILYSNKHIGAVSAYFEKGTGELGWIVNKKYWGNGFAYEAAEALVKYFYNNVGTSRFIAHCDTQNVASYKVMEKLGMVRIGERVGRRNRSATQTTFEYEYELIIEK